MKRLEISRLMDEYVDGEFFPEGGRVADPEAVKARVLGKVSAPAKQRMPRKKKLLLAGALAAVMLVLVGAGFPFVQHRLVSGALSFEQTSDSRIISLVHYGPVVELEEGRLFFHQDDGQRLDITDLISEEAPYLYDGSDPDTGLTYYVIIGGTMENCGFLEWIAAPAPYDDEDGGKMKTVYAFEWVTSEQEPGPQFFDAVTGFFMPVQLEDGITPAWLLAGLEELGIPYEYAPPEETTTIQN